MNAIKTFKSAAMVLAIGLFSAGGWADDIDLYTGGEQVTGSSSNVLIVLDNTSNFSATNQGFTNPDGSAAAQGEIEAQVIIDVLRDLAPDSLNVGLMQYADNGGGYPIFAVRRNSSTNLPVFEEVNLRIKQNVGTPKFKGPSNPRYDDLFNSVFRYFNGFAPQLIGNSRSDLNTQGDLRDYDGNTDPVNRTALGQDGYRDSDGGDDGLDRFKRPSEANLGCAKNFVIFIGNGYPSTSATDAKSRLVEAGTLFEPDVVPETSGITTAETLRQVAPYWTRFMRQYGVKSVVADSTVAGGRRFNPIQTYAINVCNAGCDLGSGPNQAQLLQSMASEGGGRYFKSTSKEEIRKALTLIFAEIQAVNSQFAAAALPVSVNARGTFENQVYIGVFRPDASALPRWYGNLKGYKFGGFCDWNKDGVVDADEPVTEAIGNKPEACKKFCDIDGDGVFTFGTDLGVNDPDLATATCGVITSAVPDGNGGFLPTQVGTLAIERYDIFLSDRFGNLAEDQKREVEGGSGFIRQDAVSYWTRSSDFWNFLQTTAAGASDSPDGPNVERGGAAQRLRNLLESFNTTTGAPEANVAARNTYTCLGCANGVTLGASSATRFSTDNTTLVGQLQRTAAQSNISSLSRTGDTITVTTAGAHSFNVGDQVVISGTSVTAFNNLGPVRIDSTTANSFTFTVADLEQPPTSATGRASVTAPRSITGITLAATGWQAQISGSTSGLSDGSRVLISGVGPYLDGESSISGVTAGQFSVNLRTPTSPATNAGVSITLSPRKTYSNLSIRLHATVTQMVIVRTGTDLTSGAEAGRFAVGNSIDISGAAPVDYNGRHVIVSCPADSAQNDTYCFLLPVTAALGTFTPQDQLVTIRLSRTLGDQTVNGDISNADLSGVGASINNGTQVFVSGTGNAQYDRLFYANAVVVGADSTTFRLCAAAGCTDAEATVTLSPATSATGGQATAYLGRYVDPNTFINWVLGKENGTEDENGDGFKTGWRASVHGDVLHSRPLLVSYDDPATTAVEIGIVGYYGGNDGFLRAIQAGTGDNDGTELWSFIPEEFIPDPVSNDGLKRLYYNDKAILYPNLACNMDPPPEKRTYFWDGVITQNSGAADLMGNKRIIYAAMRRGGRAVYAFDVTNPTGNTDPAQFRPKFAWKVSNATSGFANMGQSWSEPKVVVVKGSDTNGTRTPVLVMGGGYDPSEDDLPPGTARGSSNVGRGVYLIDPEDGPAGGSLHLVPPATSGLTQYSIPADVTTVDTDNDGNIDRIYAVDSGGNVFRWTWTPPAADPSPFNADSWVFKWVANLSGSGVDARKFLSRMAFMPVTYQGVAGYALLFGSGDRERPLPNYHVSTTSPFSCVAVAPTCASYFPEGYYGVAIEDRFYAVFDLDTVPPVSALDSTPQFAYPLTGSNLHSIVQLSGGTEVVASYSDASGKPGWFLGLKNNQIKLVRSGTTYTCAKGEEKLVDVPIFSGGFVRFATNSPQQPDRTTGVCSNLGQAREYAINPLTGLADGVSDGSTFSVDNFSTVITGGGLPPSITSGVVIIGERYVKFDTRGAGGTGRDPVHASARRNKVYWYYRAD